MRDVFGLGLKRFNLAAGIVGEVQGKGITYVFYFTVLVPFGIISRLFTDPMHLKASPSWRKRDAVPTDLESAQGQG